MNNMRVVFRRCGLNSSLKLRVFGSGALVSEVLTVISKSVPKDFSVSALPFLFAAFCIICLASVIRLEAMSQRGDSGRTNHRPSWTKVATEEVHCHGSPQGCWSASTHYPSL